jgi:hypothetical protein
MEMHGMWASQRASVLLPHSRNDVVFFREEQLSLTRLSPR